MSRRAPSPTDMAKMLREVTYRHDLWTVFSDFVEMSAIAISNAVDTAQFEQREARYFELIKPYNKDELALFPKMLGALVLLLEESPDDALGELFSRLELHNVDRGQFFTPYEVCRLMAGLNIGNGDAIRERIDAQGYVTICEPTCGAGAMIIAFAQEMQNAGLNYQKHLHVTAQDIDKRAAMMCYMQLSLLHIPAVVIVGNTLTLEQREVWYTPAHILGGWSFKLKDRSTRSWMLESKPEPEPAPVLVEEVKPAPVVETPPPVKPKHQLHVEQLSLL